MVNHAVADSSLPVFSIRAIAHLAFGLLFAIPVFTPLVQAQNLSPHLYGQNLWHTVNPGDGANQVWGRMKEAKRGPRARHSEARAAKLCQEVA